MKADRKVIVYKNVKIGKDPIIEDFVILGKPPRSVKNGEMELIIGDLPIIRSGTVIYAGNIIGNNLRTGDYARIREKNRIGNNVSVGAGSIIECECEIMDNVRIHSGCFIPEYTVIRESAWIGPGVIMTNVLHPPCPVFKKYAPLLGKKCCHGPIIDRNAVIGAGAVLMPGIVIGENAVVGAGSVVARDVPIGYVVVGSPAEKIKRTEELDCPLEYYEKGEVYSWRRS